MNIYEVASKFARTMYAFEPCRICGESITGRDVKDAVFVGYSKEKKARAAHRECASKQLPKIQWAYPTDQSEALNP